jgi:hypothetical protein
MKWIALLAALVIVQGESMETLKQYENFYDLIHPAHEKSEEAFAWFSQVPHFLFNAVIHLSCDDVESKVDALIHQAPSKMPLSFWVHSENRAEGLIDVLTQRGFSAIIACPLMSWTVVPAMSSTGDFRLDDLNVFGDIVSKVYALDAVMKKEYLALMEKISCENYVLYVEGEPFSTATLFIDGRIGGIFNDATFPDRPEASRDMMHFLMDRAHQLGLEKLIVLSSPEAAQFYAELGFMSDCLIEIYARP